MEMTPVEALPMIRGAMFFVVNIARKFPPRFCGKRLRLVYSGGASVGSPEAVF